MSDIDILSDYCVYSIRSCKEKNWHRIEISDTPNSQNARDLANELLVKLREKLKEEFTHVYCVTDDKNILEKNKESHDKTNVSVGYACGLRNKGGSTKEVERLVLITYDDSVNQLETLTTVENLINFRADEVFKYGIRKPQELDHDYVPYKDLYHNILELIPNAGITDRSKPIFSHSSAIKTVRLALSQIDMITSDYHGGNGFNLLNKALGKIPGFLENTDNTTISSHQIKTLEKNRKTYNDFSKLVNNDTYEWNEALKSIELYKRSSEKKKIIKEVFRNKSLGFITLQQANEFLEEIGTRKSKVIIDPETVEISIEFHEPQCDFYDYISSLTINSLDDELNYTSSFKKNSFEEDKQYSYVYCVYGESDCVEIESTIKVNISEHPEDLMFYAQVWEWKEKSYRKKKYNNKDKKPKFRVSNDDTSVSDNNRQPI
jgi:hypothetical protein